MADAIIIGDGPGGLSAALFLAKGGLSVVVFGQDKTAMHWALVKNYLGVREALGSELQRIGREQVQGVGASLRDDEVTAVSGSDGAWHVTLASGERLDAAHLVLSEGKGPKLALQLGLTFDPEQGIATDRNARTELGAYVVGRSARPGRSQAIISAGDGAAAAIDILSRRAGKNVVDWDSPPKT